MIQLSPIHSKVANPIHKSSQADYSQSEIEEIQKQLDLSNKVNFGITMEQKKEERKGYSHSNKRDVHGQHLVYSEMQLADAPATAFDVPTAF